MSGPVDRLLEGPHAAAVLAPPLDLAVPEPGGDLLRHDAAFETWDAAFCTTRDVVNLGLGLLGELGLHLPRLPEQSLRELVIAPVVGDCGLIRGNAEACRTVAGAAEEMAASGARVLAAGSMRWQGEAASAWAGSCAAQIARTVAAGEALRAGALLLDGVAQVCERLTIAVEHGVVALARALLRLAARLAARVTPAGWAALAAEVALRGWAAITDIVRDVETVLSLLHDLLELRDRVAAWVEEARGGLGRIEGLLAAIG